MYGREKTLSKLLSISLQLLCICCYFCMLVILNALHIGSLNVNDSEVMFHLLHIFLDWIYINSPSSIVHLLFRIIYSVTTFPTYWHYVISVLCLYLVHFQPFPFIIMKLVLTIKQSEQVLKKNSFINFANVV